ncbi:MAG: hypothetical protein IT535_15785 [Bauldia sp.]|nr:hypothetical protein [Bauldia sp.]
MTADQFRRRLESVFPGFGETVGDSLFATEDGSLTPHGLCSELSHFYRAHPIDFGSPQIADFFRLVEAIVAADPNDTDPLANALCTCFLENISSTEAGEASRPLMGPATRAFFDPWHGPPPYDH